MLKILSIDPSGTGTTGICLVWGSTKLFFQFFSKMWQEHYQYVLNLIQKEKPNIVLIETAYYESISGNKDIMDLEKLVGALECLKFHTKSQIIMRQNKLTKDFAEKLKKEEEAIPNLFYLNGKWIYYEEQEKTKERAGRTKTKTSRVNQTDGRESSGKVKEWTWVKGKIQELSQHQVDALIIWHLYSKSCPYLGEFPRISRNSRYC